MDKWIAQIVLADTLGLPFSAKARGADISHFGHDPATQSQVIEAGRKAAGLLAVSEAMRGDMAAIGIDPQKVAVHYTGIDTARFHPGDRAAARAALGCEVDAPPLSGYRARPARRGARGGLMLGYAAYTPREIEDACARLATALRTARRGPG